MHGRADRIAMRVARLLVLAGVASFALSPARAEPYPARPIRVIAFSAPS
jgi:hypothetical protein